MTMMRQIIRGPKTKLNNEDDERDSDERNEYEEKDKYQRDNDQRGRQQTMMNH